MQEIFDIKKFGVLEDEQYYYFFRALNNADNNDISFGITSENGKINRIRTDRDRYYGTPKYTADTTISLEEVFDHIKINYLRETNCISLTSSASVAINYGRENYNDTYTLIKIPKKEIGTKVFNAGAYMLKEIDKTITKTLESITLSPDIAETLSRIDKAKTQEELNALNSLIILEDNDLKNTTTNLKTSIKYRVTKTRSINSQALNDEQNLAKNKITSKLMYLQKKNLLSRVLPNVSNPFLLSTVGSAFSSLEFLHYNEITEEKIISIPKELVDIFALLEQLPSSLQLKAQQLKQILIQKVIANEYQISSFNLEEYNLENNLDIEKIYEITNGKIDYYTAKKLYEDIFYLAKSRKRAISASRLLNNILGNNNEFNEIIEFLSNSTFGIEPSIINRKSGKGIQLSQTVNLIIDNKNFNLEEWSKILTEEELEFVLNYTPSMVNKIVSENYQNNPPLNKEDYYLNAIIDSFDWNELNIDELSLEAKNDIVTSLKEHNCIELYNILKSINLSPSEISKIILTCTIRNINVKDYDKNNPFTISELEEFIGYYRIEGSKIKLKNYQGTALKKINETLTDYNFAACILPTGAGKSFVALSKMLENPNQEMLYLAPNDEILNQIKKYIKEYVYGKSLNKSDDEIIKEVFPNLTLATYHSLTSSKSSSIINHQYDFIILDELHRTGAPTWKPQVTKLLAKQEHAKILGITATPERDVDGLNMANEIARICGYGDEEIEHEKHIAYYMDIFEAIELGYIVNPKVVECEYTLETSGYIEKLNEKIKLIKNDEVRKEKLAKLDLLRKKINQATGVANILQENIKQGGKYIVFLPSTALTEIMEGDEEIAKLTGEAKVQAYIKKLQDYLKDSGLDCNYYSMLSEYSKRDNDAALEQFENDAIDTGKTKFMIVIDKLNEGVHVKGVNGLVWFRALDESSRILFLQQLGRIIYPIDPSKEYSDENRPVAIDLANNTLRVNLFDSRKEHEVNTDYDYISLIVDWYYEHGEIIPNINSKDKVERRYAQILFRVKNKYQKYAENHELMEDLPEDKYAIISDIIYFGDILDLWNTTFQRDLSSENLDDIVTDEFGLTGTIKDFYDLENEIDNVTTDEKARLYIEFINTTSNYKIRKVDYYHNYFPGTNIEIRAFLGRKENIKKVEDLLNKEEYQKEEYKTAQLKFKTWLLEQSPQKKLIAYIELLNSEDYEIRSNDKETYFPGTEVLVGQLWSREKNKIINLLNSEKYSDEKYNIAKRKVYIWLVSYGARSSMGLKEKLFIEFLKNNPDVYPTFKMYNYYFPGTTIAIKAFWSIKENRENVKKILSSKEYAGEEYDSVRERISKKEVHNIELKTKDNMDFSRMFIEFLKQNPAYKIKSSPDKNNYFPNTTIKIGNFWCKEENVKSVISLLDSPEYSAQEYDTVKRKIRNWMVSSDYQNCKAKLYIELLNTIPTFTPQNIENKILFPNSGIKVGQFWKTSKAKILELIESPEYQTEEYKNARIKLENKNNTPDIDQRIDLYIEFLNNNLEYIPQKNDEKNFLPGTTLIIGHMWLSNREKILTFIEEGRYNPEKFGVAILKITLLNQFAKEKINGQKYKQEYKKRILELAKDNIHAKKIAIANGWLALSQTEAEFQEVSSFTKAQTHLKQSMEVTKDGRTIH